MKKLKISIAAGKLCFEEYTITRYHNGALRWIRSTGKVDTTRIEGKTIFSGTLVLITKQVKAWQTKQRPNEDLSAVNEELIDSNDELFEVQHNLLVSNQG